MQTITLPSYSIYVGDFWSNFRSFLSSRSYSKLVILVDDNTKAHCLPTLLKKGELTDYILIEIPSGEAHKTLNTCQHIWQKMMQQGADRKSLTINLGGGVIGDMGGFCASTFKRGMDFVQMPTTLLSQVDASIGGKLGIDFMDIKNSIGVFRDPEAVFISSEFLSTLPKREVRSGLAEIIKHALIADAQRWQELQSIRSFEDLFTIDWADYLVPSLMIKKRIVEEDPYEQGIRKALNFGHTIGHAVESWSFSTDTPLLHGEAIAIGMICEAYLSCKEVGLSKSALESIVQYLLSIYEYRHLPDTAFESLVNMMRKDKKNEGAAINFTMINEVGHCEINQTASEEEILDSLKYYNSLSTIR